MGFVGVCRAIYNYEPSADGELAIQEGDLLFILDKSSEDDWWRAKKKAGNEDDEEPEGLIPNNYVEDAEPSGQAKALYDYTRQTDEELSFAEDATLKVYDTSDPEWTLVGLDGEFGFAPANYIEASDEAPPKPARLRAPSAPIGHEQDSHASASAPNPAAALAGIIQQKTGSSAAASRGPQQYTPEASDEEEPTPSLPQRPISTQASPPPTTYATPRSPEAEPVGVMTSETPSSPGGFHLYNIHEMISHMGKNKKMPTTLGINTARGVIMIAPEKSRDGPSREWTAEKLTHYSIEGKHVFVELVRPSKSIDFHAGARDTANEIVTALGELAGGARAEGLREVLEIGSGQGGQKKGHMLFEFMAQGDDEVTVAENDEVIVLDDTASEEWWKVRRLKNGKEGVVPSNYVEVTSIIAAPPDPGLAQARSTVEQNRLDEERQAREAVRSSSRRDKGSDGAVRIDPPDRASSLQQDSNSKRSSQKSRRESRAAGSEDIKSKPNANRVRTWTDRTGSFKVDAEFLGLKDGKIHLHKMNGVKIAVPISRMGIDDIEYVERQTGQSLDDEKPLSDIRRRSTQKRDERGAGSRSRSGAAVEAQKPQYDWFDFFLQAGCAPQICERYASAFSRDQMGEENMPDIDPTLLRTLGLKEGDILRVMKFLDAKYGRVRDRKPTADDVNGDSNGIFSGPGGALKNNTRKGRPAPAVSNNDTVDPRAFEQDSQKQSNAANEPARTETPPPAQPSRASKPAGASFDDNAWDVKPLRQQPETTRVVSPPPQASAAPTPMKPAPTGALAELSLLSPPLQPTPAPQPAAQPLPQSVPVQQLSPPPQQQQQPQPTGADRTFFDQLARQQPQAQQSMARQRPLPPSQPQQQNSFLPAPPPNRSASAPQNQQPSAFAPPPLQPQMTGYQPQIAPPGQSLNDLTQQRFQQQYQQQNLQAQPTGFGFGNQPQSNGFGGQNQFQPMQPQQTGFYPQNPQQFQQQQPQMLNAQATASPFADPPRQPFQPLQPQQTGYQQTTYSTLPAQPTGVNSFLPPPLQPQPTGMNGFGGFGPQPTGYAQSQPPPLPQMPPMPQQMQSPAPLQPQKTGPAPPVRFGVDPKPLVPQPTGRANLSNATPANPFGF